MLNYQVRDLLSNVELVITVDETLDTEMIGSYPVSQKPHVTGTVRNIDGKTLSFEGDIFAVITAPCDRCTEPTDVEIRSHIVQHYAPADTTVNPEDEVETFEGFILDLNELVLSEMEISVPMKILCKDDCKGLCPACGKNLNQGPCGCDLHEDDPRWDDLKNLLQAKQ